MDLSEPFRASEAVARGDVTWGRLRGPGFRRLAPDTWVAESTVDDIRLRARTLGEWTRHEGVVAGPLAALLHGADCPWNDAEVILRTPRRLTPPDVRVRVDRLHDDEVTWLHGVRVTTPARTAFDLARRTPLVEAVAAVDAIAYRNGITAADLLAVAEAHPGARGLVAVRRVAALMDGRAMSPMETRMRLLFVLRGLPTPIPQYRVVRPGGGQAFLDLGWPDVPAHRRKTGCEYDGPEHRTIAGQNKDTLRNGDLDDLDWDITHVSSIQIFSARHADALVERIRRKIT